MLWYGLDRQYTVYIYSTVYIHTAETIDQSNPPSERQNKNQDTYTEIPSSG